MSKTKLISRFLSWSRVITVCWPGAVFFIAVGCQPVTMIGTPPPRTVVKSRLPDETAVVSGVEEGIASWYGRKFHGRKTASGEIYDMNAMTAAHRTLPLGTRVRVTNQTNKRSVEVTVNDRGPFIAGRIIDLSYAAAKTIQMIASGTVPVRIEVLAAGTGKKGLTAEAVFTVQVGSFRDPANAQGLRERVGAVYPDVEVITWSDGRETYYRVRCGRSLSIEEANRRRLSLLERGYQALVIREEAG